MVESVLQRSENKNCEDDVGHFILNLQSFTSTPLSKLQMSSCVDDQRIVKELSDQSFFLS